MKTVYLSCSASAQVKLEGASPAEVAAATDGSVAAIGNFDGVHRGHAAVLGAGAQMAAKLGQAWGAVTFDPHPRSFFAPSSAPMPLTPVAEKSRVLANLGGAYHVVLRFDEFVASMSADTFIQRILSETLGVGGVVTGLDFRFGAKRSGDITTLQRWASDSGRVSHAVAPFILAGEQLPVSSTRIRDALSQGDCETATRLLGRPFSIFGEITRGEQRGRSIGFPTANLAIEQWFTPKFGVYAVEAEIEGYDAPILGVANLGVRPTFGDNNAILEVHLFDFAADIYQRGMRVHFTQFLRAERKFEGIDQLKSQIAADCDAARAAGVSRAAAASDELPPR